MTALCTAVCVFGFGYTALRLARRLAPLASRGLRAALTLILGAALLCSGYGLLGQLCVRERAEIELVFHGDALAAPRDSTSAGAGELRVIEERVTRARATPRHLVPVALLVAVAAHFTLGRRPLRRRRARLDPRLLIVAAPLVLAGVAALRSVPRGYDALWYHLPMAAAFAQNGHLEPPGRDLVFYFPGDMELLARSLGDLLGGPGHALALRALGFVQWPFALALFALTAGLGRRLGAGRGAAYAGAIALGCPLLVFQSGLAYADVVAAGALIAGVYLFMCASAIADPRTALLGSGAAGLCFGLTLGSKYAALPLLASGAPFLVLSAFAGPGAPDNRLRLGHAPRALARLGALGLGLALPAWFWYARNLRLTGNPVFPIALPQLALRGLFLPRAFNAGKELELVGNSADWASFLWTEPLSHESGFGPAFVALVPVALVPLVLLCVRSLMRRRWPRLGLPLAWGLVYTASWWLGTPHEARHLLPVVPLLAAPASLLLRGRGPLAVGLRRVERFALFAGVLIVLRLQLFSPTPELSVRRFDFERLYDLPHPVFDTLPAGTRVANLASRPYNLALLGPRLDLAPLEYSPSLPSAADLDYHHVDYLFVRGTAAQIAAAREKAESPRRPLRERLRAPVPTGRPWSFWGAHPPDTEAIVVFERADIGDGERPR